ncbi:MAG: hypothetical protein WB987_12145 [Candidatus Acidiferrales bacterium]
MMNRLVPKIFYDKLDDALDLFVACLGFKVLHRDATFAVVERDGAKAYLVESSEFAAKDRPELAIETNTIHELYDEIASRRPDMLHPNSKAVETKPWGAREFAIRDKTQVCVIFRQW